MSDFNVRLPQDGSGKRLKHKIQLEIGYKNRVGEIQLGDTVVCTSSGYTGIVTHINPESSTAGELYTDAEHHTQINLTDSESITIDGEIVANVAGTGDPVYIPVSINIGGDSAFNTQFVDSAGAAHVRFTEGSPQFDAFGKLQVSQTQMLGEYSHAYDLEEYLQDTLLVGSGTLSYESDSSAVLMATGTDSGAKVSRTSNKYHKYQPGIATVMEFTGALGDPGKAGVTRWMGYGEDYENGRDGLFIVMEGTTMKFVIKSSTSGSVVNTEFLYDDWTGDRLDGTGGLRNLSSAQLDPTKDNIYFIDFQWLGAGRVRFGVVLDGRRVIIHEVYNANNNDRAYMRSGSLPVSYGILNTATTASSSEMRIWVVAVKVEGQFTPYELHYSSETPSPVAIGTTTSTPLISIRPTQTFKGKDNRVWIIPSKIHIMTIGDPIVCNVTLNPTLTGDTWAMSVDSESSSECDITATDVSGGAVVSHIPVLTEKTIDLDYLFDFNKQLITRKGDITATPTSMTLAVNNIESGKTSLVYASIQWREIR